MRFLDRSFLRSVLAKATLLAFLSLPAIAATTTATAPVYLKVDIASFRAALPAPPADDSPAGQADLAVVLRFQSDRTPSQIARAQELAAHSLFLMGAAAWGPDFNPDNLPETAGIYKMIREQSRPAIVSAKSSWDRARPYQRDIRVQPCVNKPSNSSYPSGHSAESAIWAALLGAAFPDKAAIFEAIVEETMWSRIIGGVHYPTDTQAGLMLGREIARHLLASEDTQTAIATIRAETLARIQTR